MISMPAYFHLSYMMKKVNIFLGLLLFTFAMATFNSCGEKKKNNSSLTGFEQAMTNEDSVEVTHLVNQFFEYAEKGEYDAAAGMLYKDNVDSVYNEPQALDNKGIEDIKHLLSSLPIQSHKIDYIKFHEAYANEVKCTAIIMPAHDNVPEIKTVFYFKPIDYLGKWKLCMVDSHNGDRPVVDKSKKDSMQNEYQTEMREKNLSKLKK